MNSDFTNVLYRELSSNEIFDSEKEDVKEGNDPLPLSPPPCSPSSCSSNTCYDCDVATLLLQSQNTNSSSSSKCSLDSGSCWSLWRSRGEKHFVHRWQKEFRWDFLLPIRISIPIIERTTVKRQGGGWRGAEGGGSLRQGTRESWSSKEMKKKKVNCRSGSWGDWLSVAFRCSLRDSYRRRSRD